MNTLPPAASRIRTAAQSPRNLLIAATVASVVLWFLPGAQYITYPFRLFVTFVHEGGHALVTLATGGAVRSIVVDPDSSGLTTSVGGWPALIYMAGYLGVTAFGALCLLLVRASAVGKGTLVFLGAVVLLITGLWVHPFGNAFGFVAGLLIGGALVIGARLLPERAASLLAAFLAVQLCLNAVFDIRDLVWMTTHSAAPNDAVLMAGAYGLTPWFWALVWAGGALGIVYAALRTSWRAR